jgi:hypothetical protein
VQNLADLFREPRTLQYVDVPFHPISLADRKGFPMNVGRLAGACGLLTGMLVSACSLTRPVPIALDPTGVSGFLAQHPQGNLRVTEHSGRRYWVHAPVVRGDTLVGQRGYNVPVEVLAVPLAQVAELRTSHFSWGRTGALAAGTLAGAFVALAFLVQDAKAIE